MYLCQTHLYSCGCDLKKSTVLIFNQYLLLLIQVVLNPLMMK